jgi:transposase
MADDPPPSAKRQALQASGTFNPRHASVHHPLFQSSGFFDPQDLLQLKYESLRALQEDQYSIAQAAAEFGLSRPTIYQAQENFHTRGLEGLLPDKRGPKSAHKLTAEVLQHLREVLAAEPALNARQLAVRVRRRFKLKVHPRTIEKALNSKAKRGRQTPA